MKPCWRAINSRSPVGAHSLRYFLGVSVTLTVALLMSLAPLIPRYGKQARIQLRLLKLVVIEVTYANNDHPDSNICGPSSDLTSLADLSTGSTSASFEGGVVPNGLLYERKILCSDGASRARCY